MIKVLAIIYAICLIPTGLACSNWPGAYREILEGKLGSFLFFLSAWLASPFILIRILIEKIFGNNETDN